ncbi:MAG TPA: PKD domain-containing protein [Blastocatellia bacterium]|nr:PKD domain-containing protein [Blastocatellia bacterium]
MIARASGQVPNFNFAQSPLVILDTTYLPPTGKSIVVNAGGNLQTAINQAQPGDEIVLQAGATFIAPLDGFVLPTKANPTGAYITLRSSAMNSLPAEGTRVSSADSASMPKILTTNTKGALITQTGAGANNVAYWRIMGIEISLTQNALPDGNSAGAGANTGLVRLGDPYETNIANVPHDIIIDRCYIHGLPTVNSIRGINLNSATTSVVDSYLSDFHGVQWESQAIAGWNGPGPYKIYDNYLEAASENVMFGGADPLIVNLTPSDIDIRRNDFFKPLSWKPDDPSFAGYHWTVKNLLELKNSRRVLIKRNTFTNNWLDAQAGYAVLFKSVNQDDTAPWSVSQDIQFLDNIVSHSASAINIQGHDPDYASGQTVRVCIENNLFEDISGAPWGGGEGTFLKVNQSDSILVDHNTVNQDGNLITAYGVPTTDFVFTNNIAPSNTYGIKGDGTSTGMPTMAAYFPRGIFLKNAIAGGQAASYPLLNFFPTSMNAVGFISPAAGNFGLVANSPYKFAATDGDDLGVDMGGLGIGPWVTPDIPPQVTAFASVVSGVAPLPVRFSSIAFDPDGQIVSYLWDFGDSQTSSLALPSHTYQQPGIYSAKVTVTDNGQASSSATVVIMVAGPPPAVGAISPTTGSGNGGTQVTISGSGFQAGAIVSMSGMPLSNVVVVNSSTIAATTPPHAAGPVDVTVTNTDKSSCTLKSGYTFAASETVLLSDDFSAGTIDTTKWLPNNVFSGTTNTSVAVKTASGQLQIGPLVQAATTSIYNGLRSSAVYNFTGAYAYVQMVRSAASNTSADSMFTIGSDVNNYYRIYVEGPNLMIQKRVAAGSKVTMVTVPYNAANHAFWRIRHDAVSSNVVFETAPNVSGTPGVWTQLYSEFWNANVKLTSIIFEMKAGTFQNEANAPGTVLFDNFRAAHP